MSVAVLFKPVRLAATEAVTPHTTAPMSIAVPAAGSLTVTVSIFVPLSVFTTFTTTLCVFFSMLFSVLVSVLATMLVSMFVSMSIAVSLPAAVRYPPVSVLHSLLVAVLSAHSRLLRVISRRLAASVRPGGSVHVSPVTGRVRVAPLTGPPWRRVTTELGPPLPTDTRPGRLGDHHLERPGHTAEPQLTGLLPAAETAA